MLFYTVKALSFPLNNYGAYILESTLVDSLHP